MKRLLKYSLTITAAIAVILIAATLLIQFIDLDTLRERIETMASGVIGRQVRIEGHLDVNLFPHPEVILNNVSLANADWGSEPVMVRIGHLDAAINLLSLFSDTLIIRRVRLNDVSVLLETGDDHSGNWVMGGTSPPESGEEENGPEIQEELHLPLFVNVAEFNNISLTVRFHGRTEKAFRIASFTLHPDPSGELILTSSGEALGHPMAFDCAVSSKKTVLDLRSVDADIEASFLGTRLTGRVSTRNLGILSDLNGDLRIEVEDIRKILEMAEIEAPLNGPFSADTTFSKNGPVLETSVTAMVNDVTADLNGAYENKQLDIDLTLAPLQRAGELFNLQNVAAEALDLSARVTGSATGGYDIEQLKVNAGESSLSARGHIEKDGNARSELLLESPDLSTVISTLPAVPIQAGASVQYAAEKIAVSNLTVTMAGNDLKGEFTLDRSGKNQITADLSIKTLDLGVFSQTDKPAEPAKSTSPENEESGYFFKETPLPLSLLNEMNVDFKLSAGHIYFGKIALKDAVVVSTVHEGEMETKIKFDSEVSGSAAARIGLQTQGDQAVVDTLVSLSDFRMGLTSGDEIGPDETPSLSLTIELNTIGASPRQMAAAANGRILLTGGSGKIGNTVVKMFSNDIVNQLFSALNPFAETDNFSILNCAVASIGMGDGIAEISMIMFQSEKVMVVGGGDIDLGTEELNVEFNTKPRSGVGISAGMFVNPFIKIKGTLAHPSLGLDKKGTVLTTGAAFLTGGMSILIKGLYNRVAVEGDHCEKVLQSAGEHTPYSF